MMELGETEDCVAKGEFKEMVVYLGMVRLIMKLRILRTIGGKLGCIVDTSHINPFYILYAEEEL